MIDYGRFGGMQRAALLQQMRGGTAVPRSRQPMSQPMAGSAQQAPSALTAVQQAYNAPQAQPQPPTLMGPGQPWTPPPMGDTGSWMPGMGYDPARKATGNVESPDITTRIKPPMGAWRGM